MKNSTKRAHFTFDNSFQRDLEGFYAPWQGEAVPNPKMVKFNAPLAHEMGLNANALNSDLGAAILSGSQAVEGAASLAQIYAGHQFGNFTPQLGDGRALLLGEVIDNNGHRRDIHLKGAGRTPFSRGGDGKAALGPVLREYILGEAMHALGVPTTRALAAVTTGEDVQRETQLPGAVLTRVASSHIRVGTFQYFAARGDMGKVRQLADYTIARHFPHLTAADNPYLGLLDMVSNTQAKLVAQWMLVGFVHGVMNTDNMAISGETIDYGPCAFMDGYDPDANFSSIDHQGRYAYRNQPLMARWNLARLAEALLPLIDDNNDRGVEKATTSVNAFTNIYVSYWLEGMRKKLGLTTTEDGDLDLANTLLMAIEHQNVDYTKLFRALSKAASGDYEAVLSLAPTLEVWLQQWKGRCAKEPVSVNARAKAMNAVNPVYIPRNHKVEEALSSAVANEDFSKFEALMDVLSDPFTAREGWNDYAEPAPADFGAYKTFCGT